MGGGLKARAPLPTIRESMSTDPKPTKQERRDAARSARLEAEEEAAAASLRRRRLRTLLAVLGAAAVLVVVAIVVSSGGSDGAKSRPGAAQKATGTIPGQKESAEMLAGIPQSGIHLGSASAPVRLVEFADLQCPFCREYSLQTLPQLVQDYVRSGKVRMEFRDLAFLGKDSVTAGRHAAGAGQQNKLWNFIDVFYYNQGEENTGYVTPSFLHSIDRAAGVDSARADAFAASNASVTPIKQANALGDQLGVQSTPTVFVGKRGGALKQIEAGPTDVSAFKQAIDGVLGQA
jgi:protein-disulfide isomerase